MTTPEIERELSAVLDLIVKKVHDDEGHLGVMFPYVTGIDGSWRTMPASVLLDIRAKPWGHGNWFCGFWVGLLTACHLHSGERDFVCWARERML